MMSELIRQKYETEYDWNFKVLLKVWHFIKHTWPKHKILEKDTSKQKVFEKLLYDFMN